MSRAKRWTLGALAAALSIALSPVATVSGQASAPEKRPDRAAKEEPPKTHQLLRAIQVVGQDGLTLRSLAFNAKDELICLTGRPIFQPPDGEKEPRKSTSQVLVYDQEGRPLRQWDSPFPAISLAVAPNGTIYVAGQGRVARFHADGRLDRQTEVPHITEALKDRAQLEAAARDQIDATRRFLVAQIQRVREQLAAAKKEQAIKPKSGADPPPKNADPPQKGPDKQAGKPTPHRPARENDPVRLEAQLRALERSLEASAGRADEVVRQITQRVELISGLAATDRDLFLVCGELKGYGQAIWRMDLEFTKSERIVAGLAACCGRVDVQARPDRLAVADNTRHRIAAYDRDGREIGAFGKRGWHSQGPEFSGRCNPMNCQFAPGADELYATESEGVIKRYDLNGKLLALVGVVKLPGGCKNVPVAATRDGSRVIVADVINSQFLILSRREP